MQERAHPGDEDGRAGRLTNLTNIFESFLPQLLAYPNPIDPLNGDAAAMYLHRPEEYKQKIKELWPDFFRVFLGSYSFGAFFFSEPFPECDHPLMTNPDSMSLLSCLFMFSEYIQKYATEEALKEQEEGTGDSSSESSMSDFSEDEAQDMEL
ncbi:hypothetical protein U0070_020957 [Myodes glareolus]|uniref:UBC core domain-containing protein n=1 Tax=Myodes glareolus TaxID=447135 RepID=A0AAW0II16_MYOGA